MVYAFTREQAVANTVIRFKDKYGVLQGGIISDITEWTFKVQSHLLYKDGVRRTFRYEDVVEMLDRSTNPEDPPKRQLVRQYESLRGHGYMNLHYGIELFLVGSRYAGRIHARTYDGNRCDGKWTSDPMWLAAYDEIAAWHELARLANNFVKDQSTKGVAQDEEEEVEPASDLEDIAV